MINLCAERMRSWSSWRSALIVLVSTIALFVFYDSYVQALRDILGDQTYLDMRWGGYGHQEALTFFNFIGESGRVLYLRSTLLDTTWPLGIALSGVLFAPLAFKRNGLVVLVAICPVIFGAFDFLENSALLLMLLNYPDISAVLVAFGNAATVTKQMALPGAFASFLLLPIIAAVRKFSGNFS